MANAVTIDLFDPTVKDKLAVLPEKMLNYAEEVLLDQARLIVGLAQVYCPVDTGSLRDSGRIERGGQGLRWREVRVRFGGYIINPDTQKIVNYAAFVEERTPFLRPAVEEVKPTIQQMLESNIIEKAVK